jgi:hypothetical protein
MTINTDGITDEQKATPKFKSAYQEMLAQLNAPGFIPVLCAHEAAHLIYFSRVGANSYDPIPANIQYDPHIDDYFGHLAAVKLQDLPLWQTGKFGEWFAIVACGYAAGGVVARKLMPSSGGGDQDDKERLKLLCEQLNKDPNLSISFEDTWKRAQDAVRQDLQNPEILEIIQQQALSLRVELGL